MVLFGADYPFLDVLWTMIIFFVWVCWIWMVVVIFADIGEGEEPQPEIWKLVEW